MVTLYLRFIYILSKWECHEWSLPILTPHGCAIDTVAVAGNSYASRWLLNVKCTWRRHHMGSLSVFLFLCSPHRWPVMRSFIIYGVFNWTRSCRWFKTPSTLMWHHGFAWWQIAEWAQFHLVVTRGPKHISLYLRPINQYVRYRWYTI